MARSSETPQAAPTSLAVALDCSPLCRLRRVLTAWRPRGAYRGAFGFGIRVRVRVEGDRAYRDLHAIPGKVEAVVIGTRPEHAEETMRECDELGIKHVWMHRGPGAGSVSERATAYGREHGISVIDGGCPCMFGPTADFGHKMMRLMFAGNVPKQV